MKTIYDVLTFLAFIATVSLFGCTKENAAEPQSPAGIANVTIIKATVNASEATTKISYEYDTSQRLLRVRWNPGDSILVLLNDNLYKFVQTGDISSDGHTAFFSSDEKIASGLGYALYPYTNNMCEESEWKELNSDPFKDNTIKCDISHQDGTIDSLYKYDILVAKCRMQNSEIAYLSFSPECVLMRIPKGTAITEASYSGDILLTFNGKNVRNTKFAAYFYIELPYLVAGDIVFPAKVQNGVLASDVYFTFFPRILEVGRYYDDYGIYYLSTDRGDKYVLYRANISTAAMYDIGLQISGFIEFEDANFKAYCIENFDLNGDGEISYGEAKMCRKMLIPNKNISSLAGIEHFIFVQQIDCSSNQLTSLDLSKNTALSDLNCSSNQLTNLDVSNSTALTSLRCESNQLTSLDVSKNTALTSLQCYSNQLTSLDVSKNTALTFLRCESNQLTSLDVSKNTALSSLYCESNQLTSLDVSKNTALSSLYCGSNQLTNLDVSKNTALHSLSCKSNQLTNLDVSKNTALGILYCYSNQLADLDVSRNTALMTLNCSSNQLTNLDVSKNTALELFQCKSNQLTNLDVSKNTALKNLSCHSNQLTYLDVSNNTSLKWLTCAPNDLLTMLYVSKGQSINYITTNRNSEYIPDHTTIIVK